MRLLILLSALASLLSAAEGGSVSLNQKTHWFGNTFSGTDGGKPRWMMMGVDNFVVAGDRIYCYTGWEERGGEANIYSTTGEFVSKPEPWHSWGWFGGSALAADDTYVYYGIGHNDRDGGGRNFSGIARFSRDGTPANFEGGIEGGFRLAVNDDKQHIPTGVAVSGGELFVVEPVSHEIVVFSTATMTRVRSFPLPGAGRLVVDHSPERALWVIDTPSKTVRRIGRDGKDLGVRIRDCLDQVALALTPDGDLLVADGDPTRQRIQRYHGATAQRVSGADFGTPINQGSKPGSVLPGKFFRITGIACGEDGALYVSSWDYGGKLWKFDAQRKFVWVLQGTEFVSCADADPGDDTSIYSAGHRYVLDYSKPPGQNWRDAAITFDPVRYPQDPRVEENWMAMKMMRLDGRKVMFGKTQQGSWLHAWRFDGETAVPAAMYIPDPLTSNAPPAQNFSARWTGFVSAPITGSFTISATSDDGIRVSIDGKKIIDHWDTHGPTEYTAEVDLVAGKRLPIVIEYFQGDGGCGLSLAWRLPSQKNTTTIPASALSQDAEGLKAGMAAEYFVGTDLQKSVQKRIDAVIDYPVFFGDPATPTFSRAAEVWPPGRPTQPCMWMDRNGDGTMQADEYVVAPQGGSSARVDERGDIVVNTGSWDAGKGDITIIPCTGVDTHGVPQWDVSKARSTPIPIGHGLEKVSKLSYDAVNDRMYIGAWTDETPYPGGGWEQMCCGPALFRFDTWSTKPTFVWRTSIVPPEGLIGSAPKAWSFEQDYAFIAYSDKQTNGVAVDVYRLAEGRRLGRLLPNGAVGDATGWIDMNDGVQSHRRADGTYVVFAEEVWMAKGLVWLWKP